PVCLPVCPPVCLHVCLYAGVFLVCPEGGVALELLPSASEVLLNSNSNFTVCSGWSQVTWRFPPDFRVDGVFVDSRGSSSVLQLVNVTWRNSGRYTCEEEASNQSRDINIFIPGQDPDQWFVPVGPGVVMKEAEEDTIPCVVSNPRLNVSLLERPSRTPVDGLTYEPGRGFTGRLNDTSYVCSAAHGDEERESQVYYVFSIIGELTCLSADLVLKQGEVLTVNCTVKDTEMVFFTWDFPRRQVPVCLSVCLSMIQRYLISFSSYYLCNPLRLSAALLSQVSVLSAVLVLVVIAIVFLVLLIVLWRKKPRYEVRWKVIESVSPDGTHYTYLDPAHLPYCEGWEVPRNHVVLGQVLGSGAFGCVVEATISGLIHSHSTTKAAVKMVKRTSDAVPSLMSELKVLVHLGPHLNVVNLLGACTRGGPFYLITELCPYGDLANYLQRNKHTFLQGDTVNRSVCLSVCLDGGYMDMTKEENIQYVTMKELSYADIQPAVYETIYPESGQEASSLLLSDSPQLSLSDLIGFSYQISQAMDFLSSRKCVHRDLAARNVLVCEGKLVKVCDFGLARDLLKNQNYIARGTSFLPLKWMSPESIIQNIYSSQSDVWSYGVLLWEIFSLGSSPYPDLPMTQEFYSALKRGYRMNRPEHASLDMYDLMRCCWEEQPQARPAFSSLVVAVGNMLSDDYKQRYLQLTEDFLKGQNPAVVRSRWSSTRTTEDQTDRQTHTHGNTTTHTVTQQHTVTQIHTVTQQHVR
uniref:receptor protein-tyrosine kinase n=1 Tax=Amphiprion ocellaris TaxID=80972 RepID=A0A3Q1D836_AMPOC